MHIWFFDSGIWWRVVMEAFQKRYPHIQMTLYMDTGNCPYGGRSPDDIRTLTRKWVDTLYEKWVDVVILACNTASVHALRWLQTDIYPDRHILGVTVPGAEAVVRGGYTRVGILATTATVDSGVYTSRIHMLDTRIQVYTVACPGLVEYIQAGVCTGPDIERLLREYIAKLPPDIQAIVLGCTHYPLVRSAIEAIWYSIYGCSVHIVDPGMEAAIQIQGWVERKGYV